MCPMTDALQVNAHCRDSLNHDYSCSMAAAVRRHACSQVGVLPVVRC